MFVQKENCEAVDIMNELESWYNGYQFSKKEIKVYNPYSVMSCLYF